MVERSAGLKVIFIGESGAGKSSILSRYTRDKFDPDIAATFMAENETVTASLRGASYTFEFWDIGGTEDVEQWSESAASAAVVFDLTKRTSFEDLPRWLDKLQAAGRRPIPVVILGNKSDLDCEVTRDRVVDFCRTRGRLPYYEVSALSGLNVKEALHAVMETAVTGAQKLMESAKREESTTRAQTPPIKPDSGRSTETRCCQI
jgi:small GTP-binding protein